MEYQTNFKITGEDPKAVQQELEQFLGDRNDETLDTWLHNCRFFAAIKGCDVVFEIQDKLFRSPDGDVLLNVLVTTFIARK